MHHFLKLLPVPTNLRARLALVLIVLALFSIVLVILTLFEITSLVPIDMEKTFAWVILLFICSILFGIALLWRIIQVEVLTPLELIAQAIEQESQEPSALGNVAVKVMELRQSVNRVQAELNESYENLRQAEKLVMVGKLAAGVAHSVRNPLTSLKLRLFSLERSLTLSNHQKEDFSVITDAIQHVDAIVSHFLEFSRRPQLRLQQTTLSSIVDASMELLENRLAVFPVSTTLKRANKLPLVKADPEQLREVILNILLNACEAMDYSGNLILEEYLYEERSAKQYLCISIKDSGPGIPEKNQGVIFEPFFSSKEQGTGLGLPIAKSIVEEHGGKLIVQSSPQTGAKFIIMLPLAPTLPSITQTL